MSQQETQEAPNNAAGSGKKIFLLYPHSVIQEEMIDNLIMNGFETYVLHDHKRAIKILGHFPGSIMFINIDEGMPEKEWETYIKGIQQNEKTKETRLGILSYNQDKNLMQKYLMEMNIPCGYIQLKLGMQESTKIIFNALNANEAKGRRKYIRAFCEEDVNATLNYKYDANIFQGKIIDISSAGIAARFQKFPALSPNSMMREVQLKLKGSLVMVDTVFMGKRSDDPAVCILLFDPSKMKPDVKQTIHHFIKQNLQKYIDQLRI